MAIRKLLITPPLAFARLGNSDAPLDCYHWGPNDMRAHGSGKTTILPAETLAIATDGTVTSRLPTVIQFKDDQGFRPVCPFFELHAIWDDEDGSEQRGPLTLEVLARFGLDASHLKWGVAVGNYKPFHMCEDEQAKIDAWVELRGDDVEPQRLLGVSPADAAQPLVPHGLSVPLGTVRLTRPNAEFPELRLRFTPARGRFYGPTNLKSRWPVDIPDDGLFLNPSSSWCSWRPRPDDARGTPGDQYAQDENRVSLGMVDDVCDGIITCSIDGLDIPTAAARISVGPPDYAPDRRHFTSLADGLADRVDRAAVHDPAYFAGDNMELASREVLDLVERIYETAASNNVDVFNNRVNIQENREIAFKGAVPYRASEHKAFSPPEPVVGRPLPLTDRAREHHRRIASIEIFADLLRKRPEIFEVFVRKPLDPHPFFDKRMPAVMRGPAGTPLHLTRRQYDLLAEWVRQLSTNDASGQ